MSKTSEQRLIGEEELRKKGIKYSRSQRARLTRAGKFPKPVKGVAKANAWVESAQIVERIYRCRFTTIVERTGC